MSDIYDIQNVVFIFPNIRPETWYIIGICVLIYALCLYIITLIKRYRKIKATPQTIPQNSNDLRNSFLERLSRIEDRDEEFFLKINYLIRSFLEKIDVTKNAINKTNEEIIKEVSSTSVQTTLTTCRLYEYGNQRSTSAERELVKQLSEKIILETPINAKGIIE